MSHAPTHAGLREPTASKEEYALARLAMSTRAYPDAVAEYRRIVNTFPRDPRAWAQLGWGLSAMGDREAAKGATMVAADLYRERVQLVPTDGSAYLELSRALFSAGQYEEAKATFAEGLQKNPTSQVLLAEQKRRADLAARLAEEAARNPITRDYTPDEALMTELLEKKDRRAAQLVLEAHGIILPQGSSAVYIQRSNRLIVSAREDHEAVEKLFGPPTSKRD